MAKLKIAELPDDKPVKIVFELPAAVHRVATSSPMPKCSLKNAVIPSVIPPRLRRCWQGLWQLMASLQNQENQGL